MYLLVYCSGCGLRVCDTSVYDQRHLTKGMVVYQIFNCPICKRGVNLTFSKKWSLPSPPKSYAGLNV